MNVFAESCPCWAAASIALLAVHPLAVAQAAPKEVVNPSTLADTTQFGYSGAAVVAPGTRLIFVAGQIGWVDGEANDFETQVDRAFANLAAVLKASGSSAREVIKITLLTQDHDAAKLAYLGKKRRAFFGASPPASTLIPVAMLFAPGVTFEIDAVAVAGR
ncbi:MAG: RidA family protein [Chitinophagaceae bacterium]|nr:RidA family protein [Rubrivivax sp.]